MYKPSYSSPNSMFWYMNALGLLIGALLIYCIFPVGGTLDHQIIMQWVNSDGTFPNRENWWLTHIAHSAVKFIIILISVVLLGQFIGSFFNDKYFKYRWLAGYPLLSMLVTTSLIGILKSHSAHACPWSLAQPGAAGVIWLQYTGNLGKCFPGGHASAGFGLMALYFAYRQQQPKRAWFYLGSALILGFAMGWAQMMRGAHFISHNLWTFWVSWAVNIGLYGVCQFWCLIIGQFRSYMQYAQSGSTIKLANQPTQSTAQRAIVKDNAPEYVD